MKIGEISQILAIVLPFLLFIYEIRRASPEDKVFLLIIFAVVFILVIILFVFYYIKDKLDKVDKNEKELSKLKEQFQFRKSLEEINYRLGKLEAGGKRG